MIKHIPWKRYMTLPFRRIYMSCTFGYVWKMTNNKWATHNYIMGDMGDHNTLLTAKLAVEKGQRIISRSSKYERIY